MNSFAAILFVVCLTFGFMVMYIFGGLHALYRCTTSSDLGSLGLASEIFFYIATAFIAVPTWWFWW